MHLQPRPGIAWPSPRLRELNHVVRALLGLDDDTAVVIRQLARIDVPDRRLVVARA